MNTPCKDTHTCERRAEMLFLLFYAAVMFVTGLLIPYWSDDINYMQVQPSQILVTQCDHWFHVNGRAVVHTLLEGLLALSPRGILFDLMNALVWTSLLWMVSHVASGRRGASLLTLAVTAIAMRFLLPDCGYLYFWAAGSLNYVWSGAMTLLFVMCYTRFATRSLRWWQCIVVVLLSLLAGWSHEAIAVGVSAALVVDVVTHRRRLGTAGWCMAIGYGIGALMLLAAPANYQRLDTIGLSASQHIAKAMYILSILYVSWVMLLVTLVMLWCRRQQMLQYMRRNMVLYVAWAVCLLFCLALGKTERAPFFTDLSALAIVAGYVHSACGHMAPRVRQAVSLLLCCLLLVVEGALYVNTRDIYREVDRALEQAFARTADYVVVHDVPSHMPGGYSSLQFLMRYDPYTVSRQTWLRFVPDDTYAAIADGTLVRDENRLAEGLPFYTTPHISCLVMPCDSVAGDVEYLYRLYPASLQDPNLSVMGMLRRLIVPASLPTCEVATNYSTRQQQPYSIAGRSYIILAKPRYQRIHHVEARPLR